MVPHAGPPVQYLGHSANDDGAGVREPLRQHLQAVADRAAAFAQAFGASQQAYAAGLLHDLGKYADRFQRRLRDPSQTAGDHWSAAAAYLAGMMGPHGVLPALAVAGHHAGLSELPGDGREYAAEIGRRMRADRNAFTETSLRALYDRYLADGLPEPEIPDGLAPADHFAADMLDVRMLFSALVDADFLETEAHFSGDAQTPRRPRPEGPTLDVDRAIAALDEHVVQLRHRFCDAPMTVTRDALLGRCIEAAHEPTGPFSLSAPTGAGKTLAMLAFALHHARKHDLRRVILVMPFLNIIEQTADVYRVVFSPENGFDPHTVIEHHSLANSDGHESTDGRGDYAEALPRLLAENWDAPVVLTTSVQLLESLMAARPSRCRKLHRLARSVILFDEVQTLPVPLAVATLATFSRLADPAGPYGSTVVFATATQPAFEVLDGRVRPEFASSGWRPKEIVPDPEPLYAPAAGRVRVSWRHQEAIDLEELALELMQQDQVLCIVNLKRHATRLAKLLAEEGVEGLSHLSTNMCPAHRKAVLDSVRCRLDKGLPVRLVSTQCVEAGVDLDFPVVYRALAPLEAIAQAAGRCNRHGLGQTGQVVVFKPLDERRPYPPGYGQAVDATEIFLNSLASKLDLDTVEILNSPERLRGYFNHLYILTGRTTAELDDERPLLDAIRAGDFADVADKYRLIKQDAINVLVPYQPDVFNTLNAEIVEAARLTPGFIRDWIRRATPHAVSVYRPSDDAPLWNHLEPVPFRRWRPVENHEASWFVALPGLDYEALTGISEKLEDSWIA